MRVESVFRVKKKGVAEQQTVRMLVQAVVVDGVDCCCVCPSVGWGMDQSVGGFGDEPGVKVQLMNLVRSVRTVMRGVCSLSLSLSHTHTHTLTP